MPPYSLPDLPYALDALEPHLSTRSLKQHHGVHHRAYVDGANAALTNLAEARAVGPAERVEALERAHAFHLSGHVLHSMFWTNLSPKGGGVPTGALAAAVDRDFGGFAEFRRQFVLRADTLHGSGWAMLAWEPLAGRLITLQVKDHQGETAQGCVPLMVLDAWEHAWYRQYGPDKSAWLDAVWNLWNWDDVAARLDRARPAEPEVAHLLLDGPAETDVSYARPADGGQPVHGARIGPR